MASGIRVEGLRETVRALERFGVSVSDLREAFSAISREVVVESTGIVPVLDGDLQASIRIANTKNKAVVRAGYANVPHAGVINYGWAAHGIEATEFLTGPANNNPGEKARRIDANLQALIYRYNLN